MIVELKIRYNTELDRTTVSKADINRLNEMAEYNKIGVLDFLKDAIGELESLYDQAMKDDSISNKKGNLE